MHISQLIMETVHNHTSALTSQDTELKKAIHAIFETIATIVMKNSDKKNNKRCLSTVENDVWHK